MLLISCRILLNPMHGNGILLLLYTGSYAESVMVQTAVHCNSYMGPSIHNSRNVLDIVVMQRSMRAALAT
jgi:hypothetical protein